MGRTGICAAVEKREGDGRSPAGLWPLRRVLWRPDRLARPRTGLSVAPIGPDDGWCDDPASPDYNRPVTLPHGARAERLWRDDHLYDLVVVLGHNDEPVVPGAGSAIFLHIASPDLRPTEGCVALGRDALTALLERATPGDSIAIEPSQE